MQHTDRPLRDAAYLRCQVRKMLSSIRAWARAIKQHVLIVYFAARDPRTHWAVRVLGLCVAAYALSPIDLIPDFIPVLGYLDDLILVPLGLMLVLRLVPQEVKLAARERAAVAIERPTSRATAVVVVTIWVLASIVIGAWAWKRLRT
ncbi:MAG: YkvA family protein [Luteimonas sp.]